MIEEEIRLLSELLPRTIEFRRHPLGFFYWIENPQQTVRRRIHVWLHDRDYRPENDSHLHSFDIESLVITGKLRSDLFQYRENPSGEILEFDVSYEAGKSVLRSTGRRGVLQAIGSFETPAGARYRLEAGVVHRVLVEEFPCVTVLTTEERGVPIFSYGPDCDEQHFVRRLVTREEARNIATVLSGALRP